MRFGFEFLRYTDTCVNDEIQGVALQAQDLMWMFTDGSREEKFHRMWLELKAWDTTIMVGTQVARSRLKLSFQEISEQPVDDVDWTTNAVYVISHSWCRYLSASIGYGYR